MVRISRHKLYQIYRRGGIKQKRIKMTKLLNPKKEKKTNECLLQAYSKLKIEHTQGTLIIYLDEVMFTIRSINSSEFSNRYENIRIDFGGIHIKTTAVIAAITKEHGVLLYRCYERSLNVDKFLDYID